MTMKPVDSAIKIIVGPAIDDTDFKTREEALTYDQAGMEVTVILEKFDSTIVTTAVVPTTAGVYDWGHTNQGYYELELPASAGASFNNTEEGIITVAVFCTGVLPFRSVSYDIVPVKVYDSLVKGTDSLEVDAIAISGDATAADNAELAFDGTGYGFANCVIPTVTTLTGHTGQTGDNFARIGAAGAGLTALGDARIANLDTTVSSRLAPAGTLATVTALTNDAGITQAGADKVWSTAARALTDKVDFALSAAAIDTIWDEATAGHTTAATFGRLLRDLQNVIALDDGTATAGAATTITLQNTASAVNDFYKGMICVLIGGTGAGQARAVTGYVGATFVATVGPAWATNPAADSEYVILSTGSSVVATIDNIDFSALMKTSLNAATPASVQNISAQTGDSFARIGAAGAGLTALGDIRIANLDVAITTRLAPAGTLATVTNLTNAPTVGDLTAAMKLSVNAEVDTALTDYDAPTNTEMVAAFTEIKGATWAVTDSLEAIRDKETDIETDTAVIGALGAGLTALSTQSSVDAIKTETALIVADTNELQLNQGNWLTANVSSLALEATTIATLASQTSFTLTAGSADDDAYNNCTIVIEDVATATQKAVGIISDYVGTTKTVTLKYDPAIFVMAVTDKVYILAENALKATLANRQLNVAADGDIAGNVDGSVASLIGHTAQTGDNFARIGAAGAGLTALGDIRIANLDVAITTRLAPAGTLATVTALTNDAGITQGGADKVWSTAARALTDKADFALSAAAIDSILDEIISDAVHATPNSVGAMLHAVYCRFIQKRTVTATVEKSYKLDNTTELKAFTLSDDGTTGTRI